MSDKNGYFQVVSNENGTFVKLYPPVGNGLRVDKNEIVEYFEANNIENYDLRQLTPALNSDKEVIVKLNSDYIPPLNEQLSVTIAADKMMAKGRFYPASDGGRTLGLNDIVTIIARKGIKAGVSKETLEGLGQKEYCKDYVLAVGMPAINGKDSEIHYHFEVETNSKPRIMEDGSVDYFNLNNIVQAKEGDILATLVPEEKGMPGMNVCGEIFKPKDIKILKLRYGKNVKLSEDKKSLIALANGHVSLIDDKVVISDIYEVDNVDTGTGNIDYEGNVYVKGTVRDGFHINAKGNIEVNGIVEGAILKAGGDILLKRGISGMQKGSLTAGKNIVTKFIENAKVVAGGNIETECILHSDVSAKGEINVNGKKGFIAGGLVRSRKKIEAKSIGSGMGTVTNIEVGVDPIMKNRYLELKEKVEETKKRLASINPVLAAFGKKLGLGVKFSPDQLQRLQRMSLEAKEGESFILESVKEIQEIEEVFSLETAACVTVKETVYPGTRIMISDAVFYVKDGLRFCKFTKQDGEVKWYSL